MSYNLSHYIVIVTEDKQKANIIFNNYTLKQKEYNIYPIEIQEKYMIYENGIGLKWISPNIKCKDFICGLYCDKEINENLLQQNILPMMQYMKYEDIIWI